MTDDPDYRATFSQILHSVIADITANAHIVIPTIGVLSVGNVLLDQLASSQASTLIGSVATFAAQVFVTRTALTRVSSETDEPRVGGFFLLNILTTLGVGFGALFLVIPGAYLAARWLLAGPFLLREGEGATSAMRRSWECTAPHVWPITGLLLTIWVSAALAVFGSGFVGGLFAHSLPHLDIIASFLTYIVISAASVASWIAAVAIFDMLRPRSEGLVHIFD